jgi:cell division septum initiation protein DivIVA
MNEKHIEDIINALYDMIQDARAVPLASDKCIVNRDEVLNMLDQIIDQLPGELKQARSIVESRGEIIAQARREQENIVHKAQEEAERMVSQEAILVEAKRRAKEEEFSARAKIANLQKLSNEYMDDALRRTQEAIAQSLSEVEETRNKFNALAAAQAKRNEVSEEN